MGARSPLLLAAVWIAGAAVAVGTGLLAVNLVGAQVGDAVVPPLSAEAARSMTASPGPARTSPSPARATTAARPPATTRTFTSRGGTIGVRCEGSRAGLLYATPAQGYRVDKTEVEPDGVDVRFRTETDDPRLRVRCVSGTPQLERAD